MAKNIIEETIVGATDVMLPFQREIGEKDEWWRACLIYVRLGAKRTINGAYREWSQRPDATRAPNNFQIWARRFDWAGRAALYDDAEIDEQHRELVAQTVLEAHTMKSIIRKSQKKSFTEIFEDLTRLVQEDIASDAVLQQQFTARIEECLAKEGSLSIRTLKDLVAIRRDLLTARKLAIEQASAVYGFGIVGGISDIDDANVVTISTEGPDAVIQTYDNPAIAGAGDDDD